MEGTQATGEGLTFEKVWATIQETTLRLRELGAETDRRMAETDRQLRELGAETDRRIAETNRQLAETSKEVKKLSKNVWGVGRSTILSGNGRRR